MLTSVLLPLEAPEPMICQVQGALGSGR